ncbi:MAG: 2-amino-4-hydroxy-6-hydroxymethyldihydropteridine diphosphokinase [Flavobacteriales bacterium]|jgi:2-amino-4-hydroxy-6-hydroxymethyldihydropteridine diphosphokinase
MTTTYIILGSSLGDKQLWIEKAIQQISILGAIIKESKLYETAAWGGQTEATFYNQVIALSTDYSAQHLLEKLLKIEQELGRVRDPDLKYGERTIDIDILLFGNEIINSASLTIPHPRMQDRKFVLMPLSEIAKDLMHPILHKPIETLLKYSKDELDVKVCEN